jgi:hypothetical protein
VNTIKDLLRAGEVPEAVAVMQAVIAREEQRGNMPRHRGDRRTFQLGLPRRPKHFVEVFGQLRLRDGKALQDMHDEDRVVCPGCGGETSFAMVRLFGHCALCSKAERAERGDQS